MVGRIFVDLLHVQRRLNVAYDDGGKLGRRVRKRQYFSSPKNFRICSGLGHSFHHLHISEWNHEKEGLTEARRANGRYLNQLDYNEMRKKE